MVLIANFVDRPKQVLIVTARVIDAHVFEPTPEEINVLISDLHLLQAEAIGVFFNSLGKASELLFVEDAIIGCVIKFERVFDLL